MVLDDLIAAYLQLSSAIVSDALDRIGDHGTIEGVVAQVPGRKMCGPAYTVRYTLAGAAMNRFADFLDDVPRGAVVAIDNGGRTEMSVWGDTLSLFATRHDFAGTIIDGVCRDIDGTRALAYPMFSRGTFMRTGKGRVGIESTQEPIRLGSVIVRPGDLIFADDTGAVAVPRERVGDVLEIAREIVERDRRFVEAVERGATIAEVWEAGAKAGADA
ncbi:diguanylate cyclase [Prosthecomicrobium hirschii]|uniref:RraA family protein n=1 Tax=Prosthecodimorpha hirschii TaxID=665126 RepID=UPI00112CF085|nr:RraA family protein [Prosthecomicrobium hirschii]TPQ49311.1 diguanylate cyclase [Prosthecomicrobium hirschii]